MQQSIESNLFASSCNDNIRLKERLLSSFPFCKFYLSLEINYLMLIRYDPRNGAPYIFQKDKRKQIN